VLHADTGAADRLELRVKVRDPRARGGWHLCLPLSLNRSREEQKRQGGSRYFCPPGLHPQASLEAASILLRDTLSSSKKPSSHRESAAGPVDALHDLVEGVNKVISSDDVTFREGVGCHVAAELYDTFRPDSPGKMPACADRNRPRSSPQPRSICNACLYPSMVVTALFPGPWYQNAGVGVHGLAL
jgi:hypothetical protein